MTPVWTTACPGWEQRLIARQGIIPPPMSAVTSRLPLVITPALQRYPAKSPAIPKANICHGVHGP